MSRSYKKQPFFNCAAASDTFGKRYENRRYRKAVKTAIKKWRDIPQLEEVYNQWNLPSDGKHIWLDAPESAMRK